MAKTNIGPENPCVACMQAGRAEEMIKKSQGAKVPSLRGHGCVHYFRNECRVAVGLQPYVRSGKRGQLQTDPDVEEQVPVRPRRAETRNPPAICAVVYEIKDSRMNLEDCESKVCEDDEPELCELRRNYALGYDSPDKEVLQYKVFGKFQNHPDEQGKMDTYWLSMEDMVACMGYETLLGVPDLIARYEGKYIGARSAHIAPLLADLCAQQRAMSDA